MVPHEIITASAGSGKTWSLIVRWLRLLAMGAAPETIVALTFSRKAAAEFFHGILKRLALAASDPGHAAQLAHDTGQHHLGTADFLRLLRLLISRMHRLSLGTLDSFFVRIARSFPFELGLGGDFQLLDDYGVMQEKERVYRRVFGDGNRAAGPDEQVRRDFLHAFRQATWGAEENRLRMNLDKFIEDWHGRYYLPAPETEKWGQPGTIWPEGNGLPEGSPDVKPLAELLLSQVAGLVTTHINQRTMWTEFLGWLREWAPGKVMEPKISDRFKALLGVWPQFLAGGPVPVKFYYKVQQLPAPFAATLREILASILAAEWNTALMRTQGIHGILSRYDHAYHELVRRQGRLTFSDVQMVLTGDLAADTGRAPDGMTSDAHADGRLFIDYRLDARCHHWLLDEFQDTSRLQWRILKNLADEVIQDTSGERSFFAVGDSKQSIFVWRGAEPRLFREIAGFYNRPGETPQIRLTPLNESQRSGPAVIAMVNQVFGDQEALGKVLPPESLAQWDFETHIPVHKDRPGWSGLIEVPQEKGVPAEEKREIFLSCVAALLVQLDPLRHGLSCAVLAMSNSEAVDLTDYLRANTGMNVTSESDAPFATDNPPCTALMSLVRLAAHPGDDFSWEHLLMTPLASVLPKQSDADPAQDGVPCRGATVRNVLEQIAHEGFEAVLRHWIAELVKLRGEPDSFSKSRLDDLCGCARSFDASGSRDADEFLAWAAGQRVRESSPGAAVQIMTVHKSKGLTFDVVVLPDLHGQTRAWSPVAVKRDAERGIEWLTHVPRKMFAMTDPVLCEVIDNAVAGYWRERLSILYVALTRAKHANYVFVPSGSGKSEDSFNLVRILRGTLGDLGSHHADLNLHLAGVSCPVHWEKGDRKWHEGFHLPPPAPPLESEKPGQGELFDFSEAAAAASAPAAPLRVRFTRQRPAEAGAIRGTAGALFLPSRLESRARGDLLHEALRRVVWLETDTMTGLERWWRARGAPDEDFRMLRRCLTSPDMAAVWQRPSSKVMVWRERPFDMILDGQWLSGVFDRVVIEETADGRAARAEVIEFKTGEAPSRDMSDLAERHCEQAALYRRALASLTNLPADQIAVRIVYASGPVSVTV